MEDFSNYKLPSMFLITSFCDFKCCHESGVDEKVCQNQPIIQQTAKEFNVDSIVQAYISNPITKGIVFGGLEPFLQFEEVKNLINAFRKVCDDNIVIYTGYYKEEIIDQIEELKQFNNIIIKFGRFIPNDLPHFDDVLGVELISSNQYGEKIC